ncbi:MAG: hypothetical protein LC777_02990 [Actinobacteria bacterium]|nr:hypothetical protein [Actinomycetota bacterium]
MRRLPVTARTRIAREQVRQIRGLTRRINALELELHKLVKAHPAPIPCSSGQRTRHRLHRGGDRQSTTRCTSSRSPAPRHDPETKAYLARKRAEGKTYREAIRCLKRHLARRFYRLLTTPVPPFKHHKLISANAPTPMLCLT